MNAERNPTTSELIAALYSITGGQERTAEVLGANQSDVSRWGKGGAMVGPVYQTARRLIAEFRDRREFAERLFLDQSRRFDFRPALIIESWTDTGGNHGRASVFDRRRNRIDDDKEIVTFTRRAAETVATETMGFSAYFSGDFMVFRRPSADRVDVTEVRAYYLDFPVMRNVFTVERDPFLGKVGGKKQ